MPAGTRRPALWRMRWLAIPLFLGGAGTVALFPGGDAPAGKGATAGGPASPGRPAADRVPSLAARTAVRPSELPTDGRPSGATLTLAVRRPIREEEEEDSGEAWTPVPGAEVEVVTEDRRRWTGVAGPDGEVCFEGLPSGDWRAIARTEEGIGTRGPLIDDDRLSPGRSSSSWIWLHPVRRVPGTVAAGEGGEPIPGVEVTAFAREYDRGYSTIRLGEDGLPSLAAVPLSRARSDAEGRFEIPVPVNEGTVVLVARSPGWAPGAVELPGRADDAPGLLLYPEALVRGTVRGPGERGVAGATVRLAQDDPVLLETTTDASGRYEIRGLPAGSLCSVRAEAAGLAPSDPGEAWAPRAGEAAEIDLRILAFGTVEVVLENLDGWKADIDPSHLQDPGSWMEHVAVALRDRAGDDPCARGEVRGDGALLFRDVRPGAWWVCQGWRGCNERRPGPMCRVEVPEGGVVRCSLRPPESVSIGGTLVDPSGNPLEGVDVRAWPEGEGPEGPPRPDAWAETGPDGTFLIEGLEPGAYSLDLLSNSWEEIASRVEAPLADGRFVCRGQGGFRFRVGAPAESIPERLAVVMMGPWGRGEGASAWDEELFGEDGVFERSGLGAGPGSVTILLPDRAPREVPVTVHPCEVLDLGEIAFDEGIEVSGRVVDDTGAPVPEAFIGMVVHGQWRCVDANARTDAGGHFRLRNLPPGTVTLLASSSDVEWDDERTVDAAAAAARGEEILFVLHRGATVLGTLRTEEGRPLHGEIGFFPGAAVDRDADYHATDADSRGKFDIDLPAGTWTVALLDEEAGDRILGEIEVQDGEARRLDLVIR